jgi:hypothetical protein
MRIRFVEKKKKYENMKKNNKLISPKTLKNKAKKPLYLE